MQTVPVRELGWLYYYQKNGFWTQKFIRDNKGHDILIKASIQQEDITI